MSKTLTAEQWLKENMPGAFYTPLEIGMMNRYAAYCLTQSKVLPEDVAIKFGEWLSNNATQLHLNEWEYDGKTYITHDLFTIYAASKGYSLATDKSDGIGFAEWLYKNRWFSMEGDKWCYTFEMGTSMPQKTYEKNYMKTTAELYEIFKSAIK